MKLPLVPAYDAERILHAMHRSQAIIEFDMTGRILTANDNFCTALGYTLPEIVGQHHRLFVDPAESSSAEYRQFWERLCAGHFDRRQYRRIAKGGRDVWIEASYNPVFRRGKPFKVVKFATDITALKLKAAEDVGKLAALSRAQRGAGYWQKQPPSFFNGTPATHPDRISFRADVRENPSERRHARLRG